MQREAPSGRRAAGGCRRARASQRGALQVQNIGLEGSKNTRDLGGLRAVGGTVRPRMLLRGGHLHNLTHRDRTLLRGDYRVRLIIDLRTDVECAERPDVEIPGVVYEHIPILDAATVGITHEHASDNRTDLLAQLPDMRQLYRAMLHGEGIRGLAEAVGLITEFAGIDGAVLFHCTEGKDRTGAVSLFLLWMLGVPYAGIMEDYLFTNSVATARARRYYWSVRLLKRDKALATRIRSLFLADASYLDALRDEAESLYGSMDACISEGMGISARAQQEFRTRMLMR